METEVRQSDSWIDKMSAKTNGFMNSNWALFLLPGLVVAMGVLSLFLFGFNTSIFASDGVRGFAVYIPWVGGDVTVGSEWAWLAWFEIIIASLGSSLTIFGVVLTIRMDKRFVFPLVAGELLVIIDAIIVGYVFTALSYVLMVSAGVWSWFQWNKVDEDDSNQMSIKHWIFVGTALLAYILLGASILAAFPELLSYTNEETGKHLTSIQYVFNWADVICSGVVAASWFILLRKNKWGFLGFVVTDLIYIIMFFAVQVWATATSYIIYLVGIDSISFISWWNKD